MLIAALILIAVAVGGSLFVVLASADEKATVRASLRQLEGYEVDNVRDQELLKPIGDRTVKPLLDRVNDLGRRFTPDGYVDKVRARLVSSGNTSPDAVDRFIAGRVIALAMIPVLLILLFGVLGLSGMLGMVAAGFVILACVLGPDAILDRKIDVDKSYVYDVDRSLFGPIDPSLQSQAEQHALEQVLRSACEGGILAQANERGALAVEKLLETAGYDEVVVITRPASPGECPPSLTATPAAPVATPASP